MSVHWDRDKLNRRPPFTRGEPYVSTMGVRDTETHAAPSYEGDRSVDSAPYRRPDESVKKRTDTLRPAGKPRTKVKDRHSIIGDCVPGCLFFKDRARMERAVEEANKAAQGVKEAATRAAAALAFSPIKLGGVIGGLFGAGFIMQVMVVEKYAKTFQDSAFTPSDLLAAGAQLQRDMLKQVQELVEQFNPDRFQSTDSWVGIAGERFRAAARRQYDSARDLEKLIGSFAKDLEEVGREGENVSLRFADEFQGECQKLVEVLTKVAQFPPSLIWNIKSILGAMLRIKMLVMVWCQRSLMLAERGRSICNAVKESVGDGAWPKVVKG
ncbi:hypothetical protein [Tessaracoccus sp. OH4464_COT-324]|uniref:hypothetical protein n=1 Tax=Tessaracoccus sp. OH4464_COT-324 TaxID=2491059 RepID=UPI000F63FF0E|nr:hypothetical protein [Tessaracoccus sp. OH4464_COT-324]RRD46726.1 hypothetical protein EII42_05730 [Tessaracoccus sp. OH4464_COT-324]